MPTPCLGNEHVHGGIGRCIHTQCSWYFKNESIKRCPIPSRKLVPRTNGRQTHNLSRPCVECFVNDNLPTLQILFSIYYPCTISSIKQSFLITPSNMSTYCRVKCMYSLAGKDWATFGAFSFAILRTSLLYTS
jgi:hypothetical protein